MYISDFAFIPHGDMCADDKEIVSQHHKKIRENKYTEATKFLDSKSVQGSGSQSLDFIGLLYGNLLWLPHPIPLSFTGQH